MLVNDGVPYVNVVYEKGVMTGNVERMNKNDRIELKGRLLNGIEDGLFVEYDENGRVMWRGYYKNGERYSEVAESGELVGYYDEKSVSSKSLLTTAQYDDSL